MNLNKYAGLVRSFLWRKMTPETTLFRSSSFQVVALSFIVLAFAQAHTNFSVNPISTPELAETEGPEFVKAIADNLYENLRLPTLLAGLSLPILGLLASHLRSIQTKSQIEKTETQNRFSNYIGHRNLFIETFRSESLFSEDSSLQAKEYQLHSNLYRGSYKTGNLLAQIPKPDEFHQSTKPKFEELMNDCTHINWRMPDFSHEAEQSLYDFTKSLAKAFQVRFDDRYYTSKDLGGLLEKLTRARAGVHDLYIASSFFDYNEVSRELENIDRELLSEIERLRKVRTTVFVLERIAQNVDKAVTQGGDVPKHLHDDIRSELATEGKLKVEYLISNHLKRADSKKLLLCLVPEDLVNENLRKRVEY